MDQRMLRSNDENSLRQLALEYPVRMKSVCNSVGPALDLMFIVSLLLRTRIIAKVDGVHTQHAKVLSTRGNPRPLADYIGPGFYL